MFPTLQLHHVRTHSRTVFVDENEYYTVQRALQVKIRRGGQGCDCKGVYSCIVGLLSNMGMDEDDEDNDEFTPRHRFPTTGMGMGDLNGYEDEDEIEIGSPHWFGDGDGDKNISTGIPVESAH
ncbi:hypothetical protein Scep_026255 [Stephania cephalantha]|uniref:Uncharacterized protein n=1 Tax=Stephania cephalantha TaxID=152367 RepID=A0AAP0HSB9_9MAGN